MRELDADRGTDTSTSGTSSLSDAVETARVAGDIAHDLNNLLAIVLGHCELVATEESLPGRVRNDIAEIGKATQRGRALVDQLKALSRKLQSAAPEGHSASVKPSPLSATHPGIADDLSARPSPGHANAQRHILFLDDDAPLVLLAVQGLTELGHRVSGFDSADKALAALRSDPRSFDMVVTDYTMPETSGLEVANEIARLRPDLQVLVTSGAVSNEMREACARLAICEIAEKPVSVRELCALIHAMLGRTRES